MATSSFYRIRKKERNFELANTIVVIVSLFNIIASAYGVVSYLYNYYVYYNQRSHFSEKVLGSLSDFLPIRFFVAYVICLILAISICVLSIRNFLLVKNGKSVYHLQAYLGVAYIVTTVFRDISFGWNLYGLIFPTFYALIYCMSYLTAKQVNQLND